jgi:TonB-linked SusC/RagA family outer membrane protein
LTEVSGYDRSWTWTNTLKFSKAINESHHINALAGIESIDNYNRIVTARKTGLALNEVNYRFLINGSQSGQSNSSIAKASSLYSLFGKVDYAIKDKYFFSVTVRNDGSSVFNRDRRYGWFPSVSAAWRITEESFIKNISWLTDLKLRASWGKTGFYGNTDPYNQYTLYGGNVADAAYDLAGTSNSPLQGFRRVQLGDPKTGWQEDVVTNVGFESVFWKGKLYINADWYLKKAKGLLFQINLPYIVGGATPPNINVGAVNNSGTDLLIGSKGKLSKDLSCDVALTFTTYKNRIKHLTDLPFFIPSIQYPFGPVYSSYVRNQVGQPASSFFGYKVIGIFQSDDEVNKAPQQPDASPGRFRYLDANNDDTINSDDRIFLGHANPDFTTGLNIAIHYKNFDLSAFFYGSFGNEVVNVPKLWIDFYQTGPPFKFYPSKSKDALYNSWTPSRTNTTVPIVETERNFSNVDVFNSYIVEDGSYFRNKSLIIGYALPKHLLEKTKLESIRVYVQALNLFTITKYSGLDPELSGVTSAFGIDYGNYPNNQKQYYFGINVNF